jgi:hypothetical protein
MLRDGKEVHIQGGHGVGVACKDAEAEIGKGSGPSAVSARGLAESRLGLSRSGSCSSARLRVDFASPSGSALPTVPAGHHGDPQRSQKLASTGARPRLRDRDPSDPARQAVELAQRGRLILDVAAADLEASEAAYGPFHPTSWHFRNAWHEAKRSWERLRAELGAAALEAALDEPPLTVLALGPGAANFVPDRAGRWPLPQLAAAPGPIAPSHKTVLLIPINGETFRVLRVGGTPLAPVLWRLARLHPKPGDEPYFAGRLHDGGAHCDCADWIYRFADTIPHAHCKHLAALASLGWI